MEVERFKHRQLAPTVGQIITIDELGGPHHQNQSIKINLFGDVQSRSADTIPVGGTLVHDWTYLCVRFELMADSTSRLLQVRSGIEAVTLYTSRPRRNPTASFFFHLGVKDRHVSGQSWTRINQEASKLKSSNSILQLETQIAMHRQGDQRMQASLAKINACKQQVDRCLCMRG
jgi:hypothetical protein